jgi:hypothetical protein
LKRHTIFYNADFSPGTRDKRYFSSLWLFPLSLRLQVQKARASSQGMRGQEG